jgi:hypothetical protein
MGVYFWLRVIGRLVAQTYAQGSLIMMGRKNANAMPKTKHVKAVQV